MISSSSSLLLILDVRPYAVFSADHIRGAANLCIPSTILKRPAFTVAKIVESLCESQRDSFTGWQSKRDVVVYDGSSSSLTAASCIYQTARKFVQDEAYTGRVYYLKGN